MSTLPSSVHFAAGSGHTSYEFDGPVLFVVQPSGGNLAWQTMNIQPIFRLKPGLQANLEQSKFDASLNTVRSLINTKCLTPPIVTASKINWN